MTARRGGLQRRRKAVGFTQEGLAERLGVERSTVSRWERGAEVPEPANQLGLARALGLPPEELELLLFEVPQPIPADRVTSSAQTPGRFDAVAVAQLCEQVHDVDRRYDKTPSTNLLAETGLLLGKIAFFSGQVVDGRIYRQLRDVEAEAMTLMGQLVWDASQRRDHENARDYFDKAIGAARDAGNVAAEGHALLRKSYIALYGERDPQAGLDLTRQTADLTAPVSHALTGLALLHTAEAHAMLRERRPCEVSLGQAESHLDKAGSRDIAGFLLSPNQFDRIAGSCYLFLGDHRRAQRRLERIALTARPKTKSRAIALANLSIAHLRQKELDGATETLHQAIDVVEETRGGGGMNLVFDAGKELGPWRAERNVGDIYDRLLSLMTAA
jgi:transcriptional regulator with XRE-family HTH domain